jgi:hypothetical protein
LKKRKKIYRHSGILKWKEWWNAKIFFCF